MENNDKNQLKNRSRRFGVAATILFFLAALFSSISFSFLVMFGMGGIYCAFLWIYFSNRATPKKDPFYHSESSYKNASTSRPERILFFVIVAVVLFASVTVVVISSAPDEETTSDDPVATEEELPPETENFTMALQQNPNDIEALINAGNSYSYYGREGYDSALYYYNRALTIDENNSIALYNKGLVLYNQKDFPGSTALASRCLQINPSNSDALLLLGDNYTEQNDPDQALIQYSKAYDLGIRTPGLSNMLAYTYDTKQNKEKAISFYKETLQQDSSRVDVYTRLAELEPEKKDWYMTKAGQWKEK